MPYYQLIDGTKHRIRYKCPTCGKLTEGRLPIQDGIKGDGTWMWPSRHQSPAGGPCPGALEEAEWIDEEVDQAEWDRAIRRRNGNGRNR